MDDHVESLLRQQRGLATRRQLLNGGVTRAALRWRLDHTWKLVLPGVVATFTGALDDGQRLIAAQLFAGEHAALSGASAAAWHGVTSAADPVIRLLVPWRQAARHADFVTVGRTSRPDLRAWERPPLRICSPARAVADAARCARTSDEARRIVIEAVQRRIVRARDVRHEVEAGPVRGSAWARAAVQEAEAGAWSVPEADLLRGLAASAVLPRVWPNPELEAVDGTRLPSPDGWIDDVGLAIQVHSRRHHAADEDWDRTVMGDGLLGEYGIAVVAITPRRVASSLEEVVRRVERTYLSLRGRPRPPVLFRPRGHGLLV